METSTEMIKEASVEIVKDFIDNKVPLSEGIAKYASEMELNPEQIKRVVETCNTVTYLTLQKEATDRTFEFPVAEYNAVLGNMSIPTKLDGTVTEAEFKEEQTKQAVVDSKFEPDLQTLQAWTRQEHIRNRAMIEKLAIDKEACVQNIGDLSARIRKDEWALEKLAEVTDEITYTKLSALLRPNAGNIELRPFIFKDAELKEVKELVELYKEAQELVADSKRREGLEKRAFAQALAGALGATAGGLAGGVTGAASKGLSKLVSRASKSKVIHPLDIAATALSEPRPGHNVWDNLQGKEKRF